MSEPSQPIHWLTRKALGRRASHLKTAGDYSAAELAQFQAEFQRRVQQPARPQRAAKALAFLVGSLGFVVLILFMFTPLFVPLGQLVGFSVALAGAVLLAILTAYAGLLLFFRTQPSCLCPSCALPGLPRATPGQSHGAAAVLPLLRPTHPRNGERRRPQAHILL